jgi:predicted dehydrogenase
VKKLGVALVGPGRIALAHLNAIVAAADVARLVAVVGLPDEAPHATELANQFNASRVYTDYLDALRDETIDALVLTVPNHLHEAMAIAAAKHGKHVLVEKPLTLTTASADRMIRAADDAGTILMAAQCRRYFEAITTAREVIAETGGPVSITHILGVKWEVPPTSWWRSKEETGGLALGLNGPHAIDTILLLLTGRVRSVYAKALRINPQWEGEDEVILVLACDDGSQAVAHISFNTFPEQNIRLVNAPGLSLKIIDDRHLYRGADLVTTEEIGSYIHGDASFDRQMREFVSACLESRQPAASAVEVRKVVEILEAAAKSIETAAPVLIP